MAFKNQQEKNLEKKPPKQTEEQIS